MPANLENLAWPQDWKMSVFIPIQKKGNAKECSNCHTIALISHASQRRQWQPTPVLLPGKSHVQRSLIGCCLWGRIESDTTERLHFHFSFFMHWRRKWQPTPVFLPGESQGWGSLVGCRLWGRTESDTTEVTQQQHTYSPVWNLFIKILCSIKTHTHTVEMSPRTLVCMPGILSPGLDVSWPRQGTQPFWLQ